jgi:hypothetical protein
VESNAQLLAPAGEPAFDPWRRHVGELRPTYVRVMVDWNRIQPAAGAPADLSMPADGCLRGLPPCGPFAGLRQQLEALTARQGDHPGRFGAVISIHGTPEWAAAGARGCERDGTEPWSRPVSDAGLRGYRRLVRDIRALAKDTGVRVVRWSPWNEPNHPAFISPQRDRCDSAAAPVSPRVYARMARAMAGIVGERHLLLGDLADHTRDTKRGVAVRSFVAALPDDVACMSTTWAQHAYAEVHPREKPGEEDPVVALEGALDARECTKHARIWVTETGALGADPGKDRPTGPEALREGCRAQADMLRRWADDPRVDAAFQYTFREDTVYQVGLADARLTRLYPAFELWKAYGSRDATDPAPAVSGTCAGA